MHKYLLITFLFILQNQLISQNNFQYKLRPPKINIENPPVVILLHGYGSDEEDLFSLAQYFPDRFLVISLRAPIRLPQGGFAWYNLDYSTGKINYQLKEHNNAVQQVLEFIHQFSKQQRFDQSQIYLCGFSQGGIISYSLALQNPGSFKGIAVMSGRLVEEIKSNITPSAKLNKLKIFISHGTKDDVLPVQGARDARDYLKKIGLSASYHEYAAHHEINEAMLNDLLKWLKE